MLSPNDSFIQSSYVQVINSHGNIINTILNPTINNDSKGQENITLKTLKTLFTAEILNI